MITLVHCLVTASVMLTIACGVAAFLLRRLQIVTPRLRQCLLFCVLLQGLMLFRVPVELPWLESSPAGSAQWAVGDVADTLPSGGAAFVGDATSPESTRSQSTVSSSAWESIGGTEHDPAATSWTELALSAACLIWMLGIVCIVTRSLFRYAKLCRLVDELDRAPEPWQAEWQTICARRGSRAPEMLVSGSAGPMLVRRPRGYALVVPDRFWRSLSGDQRRGVLLHELAHLCRRDVWRQAVARIAVVLHWWNPAAWWCVRRYEESAEWACDETMTRTDPAAARGLAASLVQLVEFLESGTSNPAPIASGLGVQSMAAPPLTERVTRLLHSSSSSRESAMKRLVLMLLAAGLLTLSAVQFRLVAADAGGQGESISADASATLQVVSSDSKDLIETLRQRLNPDDKASSDLKQLLASESGQVAFAGVIDLLKGKYRESARAEAIPRFVEKHFEAAPDGTLALRGSSRLAADAWVQRSRQLGEVLDSMNRRMKGVADRLEDSGDVNQMARRMLTDQHVGYAIMLDEFDGRSDPIELFLGKALEKILVRRGDKLVVIPTLSGDARRQIERFELATDVFDKLKVELPIFAAEFDTPDDRHKRFVAKLKDPAMAAIVALHVSKESMSSPTAAVDDLFAKLETVSRDTAKGLVIDDEEAWGTLEELLEFADRAGKRIDAVRDRLVRTAADLDTSDPMTQRFAAQMKTGVIAYQVAVDVPYAEFDLGKQVEGMVSQVMEPAGADRLRVRDDAADQVNQRAGELLAACRTIRRYLRRIDDVRDRMADRELAESLDGPGRMLLLTEIRRSAEQSQLDAMELLAKEFFVLDETTNQLTVHPERAEVVDQLAGRAMELEQELKKDDF
ncbi:Regulatory protein BlaR1 [Stieleria neptunia]|uniref:Regulatory protein BlaR1 n=1 Tax=Stieleria neptunia TaxID=2527979 RepID=A0A518HNM1_9BACT|nr:M56 family metallopeptidase [Stieleria neptunia]QDV42445.1 Regulatory protein BlaR1 [Stieleria neptunia]